ncbi:MAG: trypsin-like peptidase domain-containing protein, partial [Bacteroidota bacterium]
MLRSWVAVLATVTLSAAAVAQPASLTAPGARSLASVDVLQLSPLNNDALLAEADAQALARTAPGPLKFAAPRMVTVAPEARGTWETLTDGRRVWRLVVSSPGAYSLNFGFSRYRLPEGAKLWIYPAGEVPEYRPFTHEDNEAHGELWTPIVPGDEAVIEVEFPQMKQGETPDFDLALGQVGHAFRPVLLSPREKSAMGVSKQSGSCNVDVVCPEGDGFRDIIRSSGGYTRSGVDICSGAAVNNTAQDGRPLFLTANHCGNSSGNAPSVVVYWNYQNSTCRTPGSAASGGPGDGPRSQFNSGTSLLGSAGASDWAILEFDDPIVPEAVVYLSGWDRRDAAPTSAIAIHHPGVEEKRISFENDPTSITTYLDDDPVANGTHIRVEDWDVGTTEGGSSGSPLYNTDKRIVGQLHGGFASCTSQTPDWYGRLYRSMNDGLAAVLDPTNSGMEVLDGKEA